MSNHQHGHCLDGHPVFDLIVIGGGITGAGIFQRAAKSGLRVLLLEQRDFAWGTSSRSSKMIHGGLRYLASGQLGMTHHSARERESLINAYGDLIRPARFVMPHYKRDFPGRLVMQTLLFVYDLLGGRKTRRFYDRQQVLEMMPGIRTTQLRGASGFEEALTDDAGLVLRLIGEGVEAGGLALNYTRAQWADSTTGSLETLLALDEGGVGRQVSAQVIINAAGVWTEKMARRKDFRLRPLRGSHAVLEQARLPVSDVITFLHPEDRRPVYLYPWYGATVIGTTDVDHRASVDTEPTMSAEELDYLIAAANHVFPEAGITRKDAVASWSGVRPVLDSGKANPSRERRDHMVLRDGRVISVTGGKLTTFRLMAAEVLKTAAPLIRPGVARSGSACQVTPDRPGLKSFEENQRIGDSALTWKDVLDACRTPVVHLDDLMLRRLRLGLVSKDGGTALLQVMRPAIQASLGWSDDLWFTEMARYNALWRKHYCPHQIHQQG
jgi:glycerol-3-phosphate dehydrogenase